MICHKVMYAKTRIYVRFLVMSDANELRVHDKITKQSPSLSQSHFTTVTTDSQSAGLSWCQTSCGTHDQILSHSSDCYGLCHMGRHL
jgi:hypothetical protein